MNQEKILVFMPAKNESKSIAKVIDDVTFVLSKKSSSFDLLVIDDGSEDNTADVAKNKNAFVIRHDQSIGLGSSFQEAVEYTLRKKYSILITIDSDGQFRPEEIPELLKPLEENKADFVTGSRFLSGKKIEHMSSTKKIGNKMLARLVSFLLKKKWSDVSCGFRAYNREALLQLNLFGGFTYTQEVFLNLGHKVRLAEVPIQVIYFPERKSRIAGNLIRYGYQVAKIIFKSVLYYRPMTLFGSLSLFFFVSGLPTFAILSVRYLLTDSVSPHKAIGIASMIALILSFGSLITGIILQIISKIQMSAEKILYYEKKRYYDQS